jgi:hypothetical protein
MSANLIKINDKNDKKSRPRPRQLINYIYNLQPGNRIKAFCLKGHKYTYLSKAYLGKESDTKTDVNIQNAIVDRSFSGYDEDWIVRLKLSDGDDLVFKFPNTTKFKYYPF